MKEIFGFTMKVVKKYRNRGVTIMEGFIEITPPDLDELGETLRIENIHQIYKPRDIIKESKKQDFYLGLSFKNSKKYHEPKLFLQGQNPSEVVRVFDPCNLPTDKLLDLEQEFKSKGLICKELRLQLERRSIKIPRNQFI